MSNWIPTFGIGQTVRVMQTSNAGVYANRHGEVIKITDDGNTWEGQLVMIQFDDGAIATFRACMLMREVK